MKKCITLLVLFSMLSSSNFSFCMSGSSDDVIYDENLPVCVCTLKGEAHEKNGEFGAARLGFRSPCGHGRMRLHAAGG